MLYGRFRGAVAVGESSRHWGRGFANRWFRVNNVTCSVGIAANKLVAKMASTNAKPNGMLMIPVARHAQFVQMMPLRGIPGIGPSLEKRLNAWGVNSVADLARMSLESLEQATGSAISARGAVSGGPRTGW